MNAFIMILLVAFLSVSGCKSYDKMKEASWSDVSSSSAKIVTISSLADAAKIALVGNPELNLLRLDISGSEKLVKESGWWEDPQFGFDLMRIVNPSDHPFLGGGALGFTVPLFGTKKIETEIAESKVDSLYERVKARECEIAVESRRLAIDYYYALKMISLIDEYNNDRSIAEAEDKVSVLYKSGECTVADVNSIMRRKHEREHLLMDFREKKSSAEAQFRQLAGLCPDSIINFKLEIKPPSHQPKLDPNPERLVSHPIVKAELSQLQVAENEFKLQIRKQYPELSIGPQFGNEEGSDRIGFNIGVTLPIWNRNRLSIAESEYERDKRKFSVFEIWRSLAVQEYVDNKAYQNLFGHGSLATTDAGRVEKLFSAGELSVVAYLGEREEILKQSLSEMEWQNNLAVCRDRLKKYDLTIFE